MTSEIAKGTSSDGSKSQEFKCPVCGKTFDTIAETQKHVTVDHMQKGEIPEKQSISSEGATTS